MKLSFLFSFVVATSVFACAAPTEDLSDQSAAQSSRPTCGPNAPPRRSVPPVISDAAKAKLDAWVALDSAYASAAQVIGRSCETDSDCATGDDRFAGSCTTPYYGQAQCTVSNAPTRPTFTCADYSCPVNFECEQEGSESVVCLEHRECRPSAGGHGG